MREERKRDGGKGFRGEYYNRTEGERERGREGCHERNVKRGHAMVNVKRERGIKLKGQAGRTSRNQSKVD